MKEVGTSMGFCASSASVFQIVGKFLSIIKIIIPVLLVVLGAMDILKAVISSDDKAIKNSVMTLLKRIVAGILVYFVPVFISGVFSLLPEFRENEDDYNVCRACITKPSESKSDYTGCQDYVDMLNNKNEPKG